MRLTVAIPCYGHQALLPDLIRSLDHLVAIEILILDDGNRDPVPDDFVDPRVRVIRREENRGLADARNALVHEAAGELVLFLDADVVLETASARSLEAFDADPELAALTGRAMESGTDNLADRWRRWFWTQDHGSRAIDVGFAYGLCCIWRRAAVLGLGGFDPALRSHGEDIDLSLRATAQGWRLAHDPSFVVRHERRDTLRSLLTMVWHHSFFFSLICLRHSSPLFRRALVNAFKWLPTAAVSSLRRHRDVGMFLVSLPACTVSIVARLWAWTGWTSGARR